MYLHSPPVQAVTGLGSVPLEVQLNRQDQWAALTCENFLELDCRATSHRPFYFSALIGKFSNSMAAEMCASESRVTRRRVDAENSDKGHFKLLWQLSGKGRIQQGQQDSTLHPGNWTIYDTSREYTYESSERARFMVLLVPQVESMGWTPAVSRLAGQAIPGGGAAHIVLSGMAGMLRDRTPLDEDSQRTLQDGTIALLERALGGHHKKKGGSAPDGNTQKLQRVREYILDHLGDPQLTPETVANAFSMSRRSLYNLFLLCEETPRAFIQQARIDQSARMLESVCTRELPLVQIARACGFSDQSHFNRAFSARFAVAPSAWRNAKAQRK